MALKCVVDSVFNRGTGPVKKFDTMCLAKAGSPDPPQFAATESLTVKIEGMWNTL